MAYFYCLKEKVNNKGNFEKIELQNMNKSQHFDSSLDRENGTMDDYNQIDYVEINKKIDGFVFKLDPRFFKFCKILRSFFNIIWKIQSYFLYIKILVKDLRINFANFWEHKEKTITISNEKN